MFPPTTFRRAYDALVVRHGSRADADYVRILHLAAHTSERDVEAARGLLLDRGTFRDAVQVKALVQPERITVPVCVLTPPDLTAYDACLYAVGGVP